MTNPRIQTNGQRQIDLQKLFSNLLVTRTRVDETTVINTGANDHLPANQAAKWLTTFTERMKEQKAGEATKNKEFNDFKTILKIIAPLSIALEDSKKTPAEKSAFYLLSDFIAAYKNNTKNAADFAKIYESIVRGLVDEELKTRKISLENPSLTEVQIKEIQDKLIDYKAEEPRLLAKAKMRTQEGKETNPFTNLGEYIAELIQKPREQSVASTEEKESSFHPSTPTDTPRKQTPSPSDSTTPVRKSSSSSTEEVKNPPSSENTPRISKTKLQETIGDINEYLQSKLEDIVSVTHDKRTRADKNAAILQSARKLREPVENLLANKNLTEVISNVFLAEAYKKCSDEKNKFENESEAAESKAEKAIDVFNANLTQISANEPDKLVTIVNILQAIHNLTSSKEIKKLINDLSQKINASEEVKKGGLHLPSTSPLKTTEQKKDQEEQATERSILNAARKAAIHSMGAIATAVSSKELAYSEIGVERLLKSQLGNLQTIAKEMVDNGICKNLDELGGVLVSKIVPSLSFKINVESDVQKYINLLTIQEQKLSARDKQQEAELAEIIKGRAHQDYLHKHIDSQDIIKTLLTKRNQNINDSLASQESEAKEIKSGAKEEKLGSFDQLKKKFISEFVKDPSNPTKSKIIAAIGDFATVIDKLNIAMEERDRDIQRLSKRLVDPRKPEHANPTAQIVRQIQNQITLLMKYKTETNAYLSASHKKILSEFARHVKDNIEYFSRITNNPNLANELEASEKRKNANEVIEKNILAYIALIERPENDLSNKEKIEEARLAKLIADKDHQQFLDLHPELRETINNALKKRSENKNNAITPPTMENNVETEDEKNKHSALLETISNLESRLRDNEKIHNIVTGSLQNAHAHSERENTSLHRAQQELTQEISKLNENINNLNVTHKKQIKGKDIVIEELKGNLLTSTESQQKLQETIGNLEKVLHSVNEQKEISEHQSEELESKLKEVQKIVSAKQNNIIRLEDEVEQLKVTLESQNQSITTQEEKLSSALHDLAESQEKVLLLSSQLENLKIDANSAASKINTLTGQQEDIIKEYELKAEEARQQLRLKEEEIETLQVQLRDSQNSASEAQKVITSLNGEIALLQLAAGKQSEELKKTKQELKDTQQELKLSIESVSTLSKDLENTTARATEAEAEIITLTNEHKEKISDLESKLEVEKLLLAESQQKVLALEPELNQYQTKAANLEVEVRKLTDEIHQLQKNNSLLTDDLNNKTKELELAKSALIEQENSILALQNDIIFHKEKVESTGQQVVILEKEVKKLHEENDSLNEQILKLKDKIKESEKENKLQTETISTLRKEIKLSGEQRANNTKELFELAKTARDAGNRILDDEITDIDLTYITQYSDTILPAVDEDIFKQFLTKIEASLLQEQKNISANSRSIISYATAHAFELAGYNLSDERLKSEHSDRLSDGTFKPHHIKDEEKVVERDSYTSEHTAIITDLQTEISFLTQAIAIAHNIEDFTIEVDELTEPPVDNAIIIRLTQLEINQLQGRLLELSNQLANFPELTGLREKLDDASEKLNAFLENVEAIYQANLSTQKFKNEIDEFIQTATVRKELVAQESKRDCSIIGPHPAANSTQSNNINKSFMDVAIAPLEKLENRLTEIMDKISLEIKEADTIADLRKPMDTALTALQTSIETYQDKIAAAANDAKDEITSLASKADTHEKNAAKEQKAAEDEKINPLTLYSEYHSVLSHYLTANNEAAEALKAHQSSLLIHINLDNLMENIPDKYTANFPDNTHGKFLCESYISEIQDNVNNSLAPNISSTTNEMLSIVTQLVKNVDDFLAKEKEYLDSDAFNNALKKAVAEGNIDKVDELQEQFANKFNAHEYSPAAAPSLSLIPPAPPPPTNLYDDCHDITGCEDSKHANYTKAADAENRLNALSKIAADKFEKARVDISAAPDEKKAVTPATPKKPSADIATLLKSIAVHLGVREPIESHRRNLETTLLQIVNIHNNVKDLKQLNQEFHTLETHLNNMMPNVAKPVNDIITTLSYYEAKLNEYFLKPMAASDGPTNAERARIKEFLGLLHVAQGIHDTPRYWYYGDSHKMEDEKVAPIDSISREVNGLSAADLHPTINASVPGKSTLTTSLLHGKYHRTICYEELDQQTMQSLAGADEATQRNAKLNSASGFREYINPKTHEVVSEQFLASYRTDPARFLVQTILTACASPSDQKAIEKFVNTLIITAQYQGKVMTEDLIRAEIKKSGLPFKLNDKPGITTTTEGKLAKILKQEYDSRMFNKVDKVTIPNDILLRRALKQLSSLLQMQLAEGLATRDPHNPSKVNIHTLSGGITLHPTHDSASDQALLAAALYICKDDRNKVFLSDKFHVRLDAKAEKTCLTKLAELEKSGAIKQSIGSRDTMSYKAYQAPTPAPSTPSPSSPPPPVPGSRSS